MERQRRGVVEQAREKARRPPEGWEKAGAKARRRWKQVREKAGARRSEVKEQKPRVKARARCRQGGQEVAETREKTRRWWGESQGWGSRETAGGEAELGRKLGG